MILIPILEASQSSLQSSPRFKILSIYFIYPEVVLVLKLRFFLFFFSYDGQTSHLGYKLHFSWLMYLTWVLIIQAAIMSSQGSGTT
jgi:hypothetical protein